MRPADRILLRVGQSFGGGSQEPSVIGVEKVENLTNPVPMDQELFFFALIPTGSQFVAGGTTTVRGGAKPDRSGSD